MTDELKRLRETKTASEDIFLGNILHVFLDMVELPNSKIDHREYIRHIGAVAVIPVNENGEVVVERQYRYPIDMVMTEIPAGKLDAKDEDRLLAAKRELQEETGYTADSWTDLGPFYPAPAYSDEKIELYLAQGLHLGERHLDDDEFIDVQLVPLEELVKQVMAGEIHDAKTQIAVLRAARILGK